MDDNKPSRYDYDAHRRVSAGLESCCDTMELTEVLHECPDEYELQRCYRYESGLGLYCDILFYRHIPTSIYCCTHECTEHIFPGNRFRSPFLYCFGERAYRRFFASVMFAIDYRCAIIKSRDYQHEAPEWDLVEQTKSDDCVTLFKLDSSIYDERPGRTVCTERYVLLNREYGFLLEQSLDWHDTFIRPGSMSRSYSGISYELMYRLLDNSSVDETVKNADIFRSLTFENHEEWLKTYCPGI